MQKPKVIILCGPTASGKTNLSIELAKELKGEIISADSMQIYRKMNIGTAKVTKEERQGIKHYMIDIIEPDQRYSVAQYKKEAEEKIEEILEKKKVPIIVGGTGLYINTLLYNIEYPTIEFDREYRDYLEKIVEKQGLDDLYKKATQIDEKAMEKISPSDKKRILRVLEIYHQTGKTKTQLEIESRKKEPKYEYHIFGIERERSLLYERINQRVDKMLAQGLIEEVMKIKKEYQTFPTAMQGLGYKEVVCYLQGEMTKEEMTEKIKRESRRYAKRQMTWFKTIDKLIWLKGQDTTKENIDLILEEYK